MIDERYLRLDGIRPELEERHIAPRDDLERRIAHIWEKLLGVQSVGIRDNFFDLGGHSLLAVRLVSEIEKEVGQRLPLVSFFQGANIEYLASLLRQDVRNSPGPLWSRFSAVEKMCRFSAFPSECECTRISFPGSYLGPDQPVFGLQGQYPEDLEGEEFSQDAVDRIATEYLEALRAVRPTGPYQFIGLCRGAHIAFEMARRLEQDGQEVALLGILDTWVMENTYSIFFHLEHYAGRLVWLKGLSLENN